MKSKNENKKIAKLIYSSISVSGKVNETQLNKFVKIVKTYPSNQGKKILGLLEKMLTRYSESNKLEVESAFNLSNQEQNEIKKSFGKMLDKELEIESTENKSLVGGIRVSNGDWVWEDSVVSKLNQLKGNFINE